MKKKYLTTKKISSIAILSAIAAILMMIDIPISFIAPSFYKADISDLPCLIGSFSMGPIAGVLIELLKVLIKLVLKPTSTAFVGELSNFLCGICLCIPAGIIYKNNHTKAGAVRALVFGSVSYVIVGSLINYFVTIPTYVTLYKIPLDTIVDLGNAIFPIVNDKFSFVLVCVSLFNLFKITVVSLLTYFLYKRISPLLKERI